MLSGPGPQLQEGSISLKFLVETRLKSESFELLTLQRSWFKSYGNYLTIHHLSLINFP